MLTVCYINKTTSYNPLLVYCRELAPGTVSLTGDWAQGDDSKHDLHYKGYHYSDRNERRKQKAMTAACLTTILRDFALNSLI